VSHRSRGQRCGAEMAASGGHILQQNKLRLQTQLKRLVNSDLKELCRYYQKTVSGNKADLQKRCLEGMYDIAIPTAWSINKLKRGIQAT
jgi:hypothetical protein